MGLHLPTSPSSCEGCCLWLLCRLLRTFFIFFAAFVVWTQDVFPLKYMIIFDKYMMPNFLLVLAKLMDYDHVFGVILYFKIERLSPSFGAVRSKSKQIKWIWNESLTKENIQHTKYINTTFIVSWPWSNSSVTDLLNPISASQCLQMSLKERERVISHQWPQLTQRNGLFFNEHNGPFSVEDTQW